MYWVNKQAFSLVCKSLTGVKALIQQMETFWSLCSS
jgi:hypothetical protein